MKPAHGHGHVLAGLYPKGMGGSGLSEPAGKFIDDPDHLIGKEPQG